MNFSFDPVSTAYRADNAGVSLIDATRCEHDHPAFAVTFPGRWIGKNTANLPDPVTVVLARCNASHMAGAFIAFLLGTEGTEAADAFMQEIHQVAHELTPFVHHLHTTGQDCCQAAYTTRGREHTRRKNEAQK